MTATVAAPTTPAQPPPHRPLRGLTGLITSTDHKLIGKAYCLTGFGYFMFSGLLAMLIRDRKSVV